MTMNEIAMRLLKQETQSKNDDTVDIFVVKNTDNSCYEYCWAWKESAERGIFGSAADVNQVRKRALRMFPERDIRLIFC